MKLSADSLRILAVILSEYQAGRVPSFMELRQLTGITTPGFHVTRLKNFGLVDYEPFKGRTLRPRCRMFLFE